MITIIIKQQVPAPLEQVSQALLAHAQLERFFNAKVTLIKPQNNGELLGGKGAIRQIAIGKIVFNEEIISASNEHICYRIVGNWPVSAHQGDIRLTQQLAPQSQVKAQHLPEIAAQAPVQASHPVTEQGVAIESTQLDYVIQFKAPRWLPDFLLKFFVQRDIVQAMKKLAKHFADLQVSNDNIASKSCAAGDSTTENLVTEHSSKQPASKEH
ncbi:SRPBCC family protein [Colwellia piezophila]|uniref:SRPBCC family protein n=1 Tax=Colwellia piezophila TaxID=211668 RepID=UPI0003653692|nr:SRPBCC family protein [Colwellia piezophila]